MDDLLGGMDLEKMATILEVMPLEVIVTKINEIDPTDPIFRLSQSIKNRDQFTVSVGKDSTTGTEDELRVELIKYLITLVIKSEMAGLAAKAKQGDILM